jgi:hypothetical protein
LYQVVQEGIKEFLRTKQVATGRRPPFALNADKVTEQRRTGQLVGMLILLQGEIIAVFMADLPVIAGHTGPAVAGNVLSGLKPYDIDNQMYQEQFTAQAYDGQYFGLGVPENMCLSTGTLMAWVLPSWDGAHRLELVLKDCREDAECILEALPSIPWYALLSRDVSAIQVRWRYGKGYEEIRDISEGLHRALYNPQTFCDTRFAQAEQKVYHNFIENWEIFVVSLTTQSTKAKEAAQRKEAKEHLDKIRNFHFVGQLMGLVDIMTHVKDLSTAM